MVEIKGKDASILYTGDLKLVETAMHKGAKPRESDFLIIEGTYWDRNHPERKELEKIFYEEVKSTLEEGGTALVSAFALGRTQELIKVLRKFDKHIPIYVDGMGVKISKIYLKYPGFIKDFVGFEKAMKTVELIEHPKQREKALKSPSVIITTAGMLEGGPVLHYITRINKKSKIFITGYCVEGTNGDKLLKKGVVEIDGYELSIDVPVHYMDFSAHAGREELLEFIEKSNPEKIMVVHSDNTKAFAEELKEKGFDAFSLKLGETKKIRI